MVKLKVKQISHIYDGRYYIDEEGNVFTKYNHLTKKFQDELIPIKTSMLLSKNKKQKYKVVYLCIGGKVKNGSKKGKTKKTTFYVNRLLADTFLNGEKGSKVIFKNGNKMDTKLANIERCYRSRDVVFKNEKDKQIYLKTAIRLKNSLNDFQEATIEYLNGDKTKLFQILYDRGTLLYMGSILCREGFNKRDINDFVKDCYVNFLKMVEEGTYRVHIDGKVFKNSKYSFLGECVRRLMYEHRSNNIKMYENQFGDPIDKSKKYEMEETDYDDLSEEISNMFDHFS